MVPICGLLELLKNVILSTVDNTVRINKDFLTDIHSCLQDAHENIEFLQLESQLQQEELPKRSNHFEPISVQKIERDSHQKQEYKVAIDSHLVPCTSRFTCRCSSSVCTSQAHHQTLGRACPQQAQN